jgi:ribonuclease BN (tRNA processing enzyme)
MSLQVTVLGSGTIIPTVERRSTSVLLEAANEPYLFECGPGTLEGLEEAGVSFRSLDHVLLSHFHPDHTLGIGHLIAALNNDRSSIGRGPLTFYGPEGLVDFFRKLNDLYPSTVPREDYLSLVEVAGGGIQLDGGVRIRAGMVNHGDHAALAYRAGYAGTSVVYSGDTAFTESLVELARGADLLLSECSFPDDNPMDGHMTPSEVGRLAAAAGVGKVALLHMYPVFEGENPAKGVKRYYNGPVIVARDGLKIEF